MSEVESQHAHLRHFYHLFHITNHKCTSSVNYKPKWHELDIILISFRLVLWGKSNIFIAVDSPSRCATDREPQQRHLIANRAAEPWTSRHVLPGEYDKDCIDFDLWKYWEYDYLELLNVRSCWLIKHWSIENLMLRKPSTYSIKCATT